MPNVEPPGSPLEVYEEAAYADLLRRAFDSLSTEQTDEPENHEAASEPFKEGLDRYRGRLSRIPLLDEAEERELSLSIEAGILALEHLTRHAFSFAGRSDYELLVHAGNQAYQQFVTANIRLAIFWAVRYQNRGLPLDDLVQEGTLGLMRAVHMFDIAQGYKFSTYATWWIKQHISRAIADQGRNVRLPVHVYEKSRLAERLHAKAAGDENGERDALEGVGLTPDQAMRLRRLRLDELSLDRLLHDELLDECDPTEERFEEWIETHVALASDVSAAVGMLPERLSLVLDLRYGMNSGQQMTLEEVGKHLGITRERVRQLERKAWDLLREEPVIRSWRAADLRAEAPPDTDLASIS